MAIMTLKIQEIIKATGGKLLAGNSQLEIKGVAIDSRKVKPGDLFVALMGEKTNGHMFVQAAFAKGAIAALVKEEKNYSEKSAVIKVEDPLKALQELAKYYRRKLKILVIGVTGSSGKTTTKDIIGAVLQEKFNVLKTIGNYNNEIGLPLTLLELTANHHIAVLEMGMRGLGQIQQLTKIAEPTIGVITNIGRAHLELLGSREKIAEAKGELIYGLPQNGVAVLNGEDEFCRKIGAGFTGKKVFFGFHSRCDIIGKDIRLGDFSSQFTIECARGDIFVQIPLPGEYNILNALAAVAVGLEVGLDLEQIKAGLTNIQLTQMRLEKISGARGETIINDAYNANPDSMVASLEILHNFSGMRKVAILGDMYELGLHSEAGHRQVGAEIAKMKIDMIITVGEQSAMIGEEAIKEGYESQKVKHFSLNKDAAVYLQSKLTSSDVVLIKGSRGMAMEKIVDALKDRS